MGATTTTLAAPAAAVAEAAMARSAEIERAGDVPIDLVEQLEAEGLLRLFVPRAYGGAETDPITAFDVVEALSYADGSLGWIAFVLNGSCFACWLEPSVAAEVLAARPGSGIGGVLAPIGRATATADGLRLSGRFPFNSGSPHASWLAEGGFVVDDEGAVRTRPDGQPDARHFFVPAGSFEILDTWHVAGLRGTASHDVTVDGVVVPVEHTTNLLTDEAPCDSPIFRWPVFSIVSPLICAVGMGIARRALEEFTVLAATKSRRTSTALADTEVVALAAVQAVGALRAARSLLVDTYGAAWNRALAGDRLQTADRAAIRTAAIHAMRASVEVVDAVFAMAGGGALYDTSPLQRCWRDVHAASQHIYFCPEDARQVGRHLLTGAEPTISL
jgi:alkylation response protein AidB-like acyl-CoA dehydrogenase